MGATALSMAAHKFKRTSTHNSLEIKRLKKKEKKKACDISKLPTRAATEVMLIATTLPCYNSRLKMATHIEHTATAIISINQLVMAVRQTSDTEQQARGTIFEAHPVC